MTSKTEKKTKGKGAAPADGGAGGGFDATKAMEILEKVSRPLIEGITIALPPVIKFCQKVYGKYQELPADAVKLAIGFLFCFFGGMYPTLFASIQAAKHGGIQTVVVALKDLSAEAMTIIEESKKDDAVDADKDGVADVKQIDSKELLIRKGQLILRKMNPAKVDLALGNIYSVWISVIAVLKLQFAQVIALSLTICAALKKPIDKYLTPKIQALVPDDYQKWVPVLVGWIAKTVAISVAWTIQTVISAFTSALEGGLIMARAVLKILVAHDINPGGMIPENHEDTRLDEYASYAIALVGFYFQLRCGFSVPFPLNLVLFPVSFTEYWIRWQIS